jgi:hypothetical protein
MWRSGLVIPLVVLSGACGAMYNDGLKSDLEKRATFDLDCPASKMHYRELSETNGLVTSYGVRGCGQKATYVLNVQSSVWVQNSGDSREK